MALRLFALCQCTTLYLMISNAYSASHTLPLKNHLIYLNPNGLNYGKESHPPRFHAANVPFHLYPCYSEPLSISTIFTIFSRSTFCNHFPIHKTSVIFNAPIPFPVHVNPILTHLLISVNSHCKIAPKNDLKDDICDLFLRPKRNPTSISQTEADPCCGLKVISVVISRVFTIPSNTLEVLFTLPSLGTKLASSHSIFSTMTFFHNLLGSFPNFQIHLFNIILFFKLKSTNPKPSLSL